MAEITDQVLVTDVVQKRLEELLKEQLIKEYKINISPGATRGDNYLGVMAKVQVNGKDESGESVTLNLMVKSAPRQEAFRSLNPIRVAYERETYLYSKVLQEFTKLQEESAVLNPFKSFAKYYTSTMDNMNEAIIMENMKEQGFQLWDRHKSLDYNHTLLVMKEYGKFHALSYAIRDQKPELFAELAAHTEEMFFSSLKITDEAKKGMKQWTDKAVAALDPINDKTAYDKLIVFQENMFDIVQEIIKSEPAGKYAVIGHRDSWVNNMLFKYSNTANQQVPTDLCLLDWQLARFGSPALDLSYFIFTCTDKELRDQHYEHLIEEYYKSLSNFLRKLGSDPEELLPFNILQEHLKKFSVFGLYMALMVLHLIVSDAEEIPDVHNEATEEDVFKGFNFSSKNVGKYHKRVRGVLLDFLKYDYDF